MGARRPGVWFASLLHLAACLFLTSWMALVQPGLAIDPGLSPYPTLYLRGGRPLAPGESVVELIAVGDVMLGRGVAEVDGPLADVAPWLSAADVAFGNLEGVIGEGGSPRAGPFRLQAKPEAAQALADAGLDILGLANNHALDFGPAGLAETAAHLARAGIVTLGAGGDWAQAQQPRFRQVGGLKVAFLAYNTVPDPEDQATDRAVARWDAGQAATAVAAAQAQADLVIVSIHWGYEYQVRVDPSQEAMARICLEAGADLVVGHHPHVVQGTLLVPKSPLWPGHAARDRFVAYSLGNLVFDRAEGETRYGLALRVFADRQGLRAIQALPLWAGPRPRLMSPDEAECLLARLMPDPAEPLLGNPQPGDSLAFACDPDGCWPVPAGPGGQGGLFASGRADLTGDGVEETLSLSHGRLEIHSESAWIWHSPAEWHVVDLATGDADDDGRADILLALWKQDEAGGVRSHPFLIGFREGAYRVLWGGSAVVDPIHEVEVGDVDGDGVQELLVIQGQGKDTSVAAWRWHGWGFSLVWHSRPGAYHDLELLPAGMMDRSVIAVTSGDGR